MVLRNPTGSVQRLTLIYAVAMLALSDRNLAAKLTEFRARQSEAVKKAELPKP